MSEPRPLYLIADEINEDFRKNVKITSSVATWTAPYRKAMRELSTVDDKYGADTGKYIVNYFLSNAGGWRGDVARRIKKELKSMV